MRVLYMWESVHEWELKPCVPVEAFLSWGHLDVDPWAAAPWGAWPCQPLWSPPIWWCGGPSMHAPLLQTSSGSLSNRPLGVLSAWSSAFFWSHQCSSCHNCRGFSTPPWPSSLLVEGSSPCMVSTEWSDRPALKITFIPYFPHTRLMSSLTLAVYGSTTKGGCFSPVAGLGGPPHVEEAERQS